MVSNMMCFFSHRLNLCHYVLEPALRRVFRGAREVSLRALAHRLIKRTVPRGTSLFYDLDRRGGGESQTGGGFFLVMEGDMLVTIPTPAAAAEAQEAAAAAAAAAHVAVHHHHRQYRFETAVADIEERDYHVLGVVKAGHAFSYLGAEALVAGIEDPAHVEGVLRALKRGGAGAQPGQPPGVGTRPSGDGGDSVDDNAAARAGAGAAGASAHPSPPRVLLGLTRVTALSTAEIYEIPPAAAARLIAVERPDLLLALISNVREELELLASLPSAEASATSIPAAEASTPAALSVAVLERSLEVMTAVARVVCGADASLPVSRPLQ